MNWKWPYNKKHFNLNPWYTIIRRAIVFPFLVVSFVLFIVVTAMCYGCKEAGSIAKKIRLAV